MTEQDKALQDLLLYGQSFMQNGKHIPLERTMIDMISYDQAIMAGAEYLEEEAWGKTKYTADVIALMFHKNNGEVYLDLKAERKEQRKVM